MKYKEYHDTTVGHDGRTYDVRANLYFDGEIHVDTYKYMDENNDWRDLDEREELAEYLNENYTWEQL